VKTYLDSSALVKVYVTEEFSVATRREVQSVGQLPLTGLHVLEITNAFHVLAGRRLLSPEELRGLLDHFEDDRQSRRLAGVALDWPKVFHEAVQLARTHSRLLLCRSLDILHVAAAVELGCTRLVSADDRQLSLARAAGLGAVDIKKTR